jgi:hypothetical protein
MIVNKYVIEWVLYFGLDPLKPIPLVKGQKLLESSDYFCGFLASKAFTTDGIEVKEETEVRISKSGLNKNDLEEEIGVEEHPINPQDIAGEIFVSIFKTTNPLIALVPKPFRTTESKFRNIAFRFRKAVNPSKIHFNSNLFISSGSLQEPLLVSLSRISTEAVDKALEIFVDGEKQAEGNDHLIVNFCKHNEVYT